MYILNFFKNLLGKKTSQENTISQTIPEGNSVDTVSCNDFIFHQEGFEEFERKIYLELNLRKQKSTAIIEANGDLSKVFCLYDLKKSNYIKWKDDKNIIGYYSSVRKLGLANGFGLSSLYRHQKSNNHYYLDRYKIISLEDENQENN